MRNAIRFAYDLCSIPSITGDEQRLVQFLSDFLRGSGLTVKLIPLENGRSNIFAFYEDKPRYTTIFCSHIDTVAPFIAPELSNDELIGRGACDAKGIIAAMVYSVLEQKELGFSDVALLFTVGEETTSDGAKVCNESLRDRARYIVIGEPTECKAARAQKGSIAFDLIARGEAAHSSRPELGSSAIHKLILSMERLIKFSWPRDEIFGETLINFGLISGGEAQNILAASAKASGLMRASRETEGLILLIESQLDKDVTLAITSLSEPMHYVVPKGYETFLAGFGSDAPYLQAVGKPILLGPGSIELAHKSNERIKCSEIISGIATYQDILTKLRTMDD